ncbi:MAG: glycosyltransferase family 2 protein, partial [Acidimicrobiales bacterium]
MTGERIGPRPARPGERVEASVGLLLTTYNSAPFIDQALASIATQTRLPDHIVLVDDASTDQTVCRARAWQTRLPLEVVVLPTNGGVSRARNAGAKLLGTDLIAILDGDDVVLPDHVELLADRHRQRGGIVSPKAYFWVPGRRCTPYQRRLRGLNLPRTGQLRRLVRKNYVFVASMVSRRDFELVGGYTEGPPHQDMTSDWDLWLRMVAAGNRVSQAPFATVLYRVVPGSMADDT